MKKREMTSREKAIQEIIQEMLIYVPEMDGMSIEVEVEQYPDNVIFVPGSKNNPPYAGMTYQRKGKKGKDSERILFKIFAFLDTFRVFGDEVYEGTNVALVSFMNDIDVPFTEDSLLVFNVLHEMGHVDTVNRFIELSGNIRQLYKMDDVTNITLDLIFGMDHLDHGKQIHINDHFNYNELAAEKFAYQNFPRIWKLFKDRF